MTAPLTLYLGQSLFSEKIESRRIVRNLAASLPQLALYQVLLRGVLLLPVLTWFLPFVTWPYLNEVILLERNRLFGGRSQRMTTGRRKTALHSGSGGDLFAQWLLAMLVGVALAHFPLGLALRIGRPDARYVARSTPWSTRYTIHWPCGSRWGSLRWCGS